MNERIRELAFESGCHRRRYWDQRYPELERFIISQAELDKFAELIVKECENVSLKNSHRNDDMGAIIARHIKQHFGMNNERTNP